MMMTRVVGYGVLAALLASCGKTQKKSEGKGAAAAPAPTELEAPPNPEPGVSDQEGKAPGAVAKPETPKPGPSTPPATCDNTVKAMGLVEEADAPKAEDESKTQEVKATACVPPSPVPPSPVPPSPGTDFQMIKSYVTPGGTQSGYLKDGGVYFAPKDGLFFAMSYQTIGTKTTAIAELYAKEASYLTKPEYIGAFHKGTCAKIGERYQHIKGDTTLGKSEFIITLKGTGTKRAGTGVAEFALPSGLVFRIKLADNISPVCMEFAEVKQSSEAAPQ
jgi:hypothetical protein